MYRCTSSGGLLSQGQCDCDVDSAARGKVSIRFVREYFTWPSRRGYSRLRKVSVASVMAALRWRTM
jgi:hypothetical protein